MSDKQGRVLYSFYIRPAAKAEVEKLAKARGESVSETLRKLLRLGLQHAAQLDGVAAQATPAAPSQGTHPSGGFAAARDAKQKEGT